MIITHVFFKSIYFILFFTLGCLDVLHFYLWYGYKAAISAIFVLRFGEDAYEYNYFVRGLGTRTWAVRPCEDGPPKREASCSNTEAEFTLLAYMGIKIWSRHCNVASCDN